MPANSGIFAGIVVHLRVVLMLRALLALACGLTAGATLAQPWYYTLGEERADQQAHFCSSETEVRTLAAIFRDKGARPGFFALKQMFDCVTRIDTFTPLEVVDRAYLEAQAGSYTVLFVRARTAAGDTAYLVTTRDVREP